MITVQQLRATGQLVPFSDAELELLLGATVPRTFGPGELLSLQGRPATSCFIIVSGTVTITKESDGQVRCLAEMSEGGIVGQLALVDRRPRSATVRAKDAVVALELTRDVFDRLVGSSSPLAYRFQVEIAVATGRQLREANGRLAAILEARADRRGPAYDLAERAALERLRDAVGDIEVPFDIVEVTPADRVIRASDRPPAS
jgi:CRP-like cAMP-binding protein